MKATAEKLIGLQVGQVLYASFVMEVEALVVESLGVQDEPGEAEPTVTARLAMTDPRAKGKVLTRCERTKHRHERSEALSRGEAAPVLGDFYLTEVEAQRALVESIEESLAFYREEQDEIAGKKGKRVEKQQAEIAKSMAIYEGHLAEAKAKLATMEEV